MAWTIIYHPDVPDDLRRLGRAEARRIVAAIDERIRLGEPDKIGKSLRRNLAGCRRIRVGETRIVYRLDENVGEVLIVAIGPRRGDEAYRRAGKRARQQKKAT